MNVHEYQAKELLKSYGVPVDRGFMVQSLEEIAGVLDQLPGPGYVVKAQIHSGGRGKGGGVKLAQGKDQALQQAKNILGMNLVTNQTGPGGRLVSRLLITEAVNIDQEYYLSLLIDRAVCKYVFVASTEGGMEIEKVAEEKPDSIIKIHVDPFSGFKNFHGLEMAGKLGFSGDQTKQLTGIMRGLYNLFIEKDASLVEINPLVKTKDGRLLAIDAKVNFDDNGLGRHPEIMELRDVDQEDPNEVQASKYDLSYIKLDGTIGCLVNGAGLAMATMDIVKLHGGSPANFLDVGGSATAEKVTEAFKIILSDPNVKGILVNIFGGIMKCDVIAEGIVSASRSLGVKVPIVARLDGTNVEQGRKILAGSGLKIIPAGSLNEAAKRIVAEAESYGHSN
jgi:succinyl-CoA synthetase beta subunit